MTQQEVQERNKQIALMLGLKHDEHAVIFKMTAYSWDMLRFDLDWNWLMEAVEFIQSLRLDIPEYNVVDYYIVTSSSTFCNIRSGLNHADGETKSPFFYNKSSVGKNQKEAVFIAVSDFAKLYNEGKL